MTCEQKEGLFERRGRTAVENGGEGQIKTKSNDICTDVVLEHIISHINNH